MAPVREGTDRAETGGGRAATAALIAIIAVGVFARFLDLGGKSFWLDELFMVQTVGDGLPGAAQIALQTGHMPPFRLLEWGITQVADREWWVRLPSAIAGALAIPAAYVLTRDLWCRRGGLFAALLTALSSFDVWYSQDATAYSLLILLAFLQMWSAVRAVTRGRPFDWRLLAFIVAANLYTDYLALPLTAGTLAYVAIGLWRRRRSGAKVDGQVPRAVVALEQVTIIYLPWLPIVYILFSSSNHLFPSAATLSGVGLALVEGLGLAGVIGILALIGLAVALRSARARPDLPLLLLLHIAAVLGLIAVTHSWWNLNARYLYVAFPMAVLLGGVGADAVVLWVAVRLSQPLPRIPAAPIAASCLVLLVVASMGWSLTAWEGTPKEMYRQAYAGVIASSPPDSVVLVEGNSADWAILAGRYYAHRAGVQLRFTSAGDAASIAPAFADQRIRVWAVVLTGEDPYGVRRLNYTIAPTVPLIAPPSGGRGIVLHRWLGITIAEAPSAGDPVHQAELLLRWGVQFDPALACVADRLEATGPAVPPRC